jgi:hypothetical protein
MAKVQFDGVNREINVLSGTTNLDVQIDLYSEWKRWSAEENNLKYLQAFRTFGGDQTIAGQFAPRYFFLTNGWRIIVSTGVDLVVGSNLYTDELDSPFIASNDSTVSLTNSDAAVVDNGVSQNLDYGGEIQVNPLLGLAGTTYPIGTLAQPVNNISDALTLSNQLGIFKLKIYGDVIVDQNLNNFVVVGGNFNSSVTIDGVNVSGTTFERCVIKGEYDGNIRAYECELEDGVFGLGGQFNYCGINGSIFAKPNTESRFIDCYTNGLNPIDLHMNVDSKVRMRGYTGAVNIYDCQSGSTLNIAFVVGQAYILTGNTGGDITLLGTASFDNQSSGTTVNTVSLVVPYDIATQHLLNVNTEILRNK